MKNNLSEGIFFSKKSNILTFFKTEMEAELASILDWWMENMIDETNGGFYGKIDAQNQLHPEADKGVILNTRILWTFSAAANSTKNKEYENIAHRAFEYLVVHFFDKKNGGLYWMLDYQGKPTQTKKQIYALAFGIYGLSEYYHLTKNKKAIELANELFEVIEEHSFDKIHGGYFEAFTEDWQAIEDLRLSEKDANEAKTMNTHLHIMEAYMNLYRVFPNKKIGDALQALIECFLEKFIKPKSSLSGRHAKHLHLFFDEKWNSKSNAISYGHDIECSWLLQEAAEILGNKKLLQKVKETALEMATATLENGFDNSGGIMYEKENNHFDKEKHWWVQAEAVVGFFNAYEISKEEKFVKASLKCWGFIKQNILDRENGEWVWSIFPDGKISQMEDKAGAWKAPYHNGRMCLEIIKRMN